MPLHTHENYCQEVWDLGRSIEKLNNFLRLEYWEICPPSEMRRIYRFIKFNVNKIRTDINDYDTELQEEDLFVHLNQERFTKLYDYLYEHTIQFPKRDIIMNYLENIINCLRQLNIWFDTPTGQVTNWGKVYSQYEKDVVMTWWSISELMNYIPDDTIISDENN
jgi:hypothetical protein